MSESVANHPIAKLARELLKQAHRSDDGIDINISIKIKGKGSLVLRQTPGNKHISEVIREGETSRHEITSVKIISPEGEW